MFEHWCKFFIMALEFRQAGSCTVSDRNLYGYYGNGKDSIRLKGRRCVRVRYWRLHLEVNEMTCSNSHMDTSVEYNKSKILLCLADSLQDDYEKWRKNTGNGE